MARYVPALVHEHIDSLLAALLALCEEQRSSPLTAPLAPGEPTELAELEALNRNVTRDGLRIVLARTIGRLAHHSSSEVLERVLPLWEATTGEPHQDRQVRTYLLNVLTEAASPATLRDTLPVLYTALLGTDQVVRARAVRLWAACAETAPNAMPEELPELAEALLTDQYLIVVRAMMGRLPALRLPDHLAARLLPLVAGCAQAYVDDAELLDDALVAVRVLALRLDNKPQALQWQGFALSLVSQLEPHDRERMLTWRWPTELRMHPMWTMAALGAMASPELFDPYQQRGNPLLEELVGLPEPMTAVPLEDFQAVTEARLQYSPWQALEPVELLQIVGRLREASTLANKVLQSAPQGIEGESRRDLATLVHLAAQLSVLLTEDNVDVSTAIELAYQVQQARDNLAEKWHVTESDSSGDRRARRFLNSATASADIVLAVYTAPDGPDAKADALDTIAVGLLNEGNHGASYGQRNRLGLACQIVALLYRFDAAIQQAAPDAARFKLAADRKAQLLREEVTTTAHVPVPQKLLELVAATESMPSASAVEHAALSLIGVTAPIQLIFLPRHTLTAPTPDADQPQDEPFAVCVASVHGAPVTDVLVVRPREIYQIDLAVRLSRWPDWADTCRVEPVTTLSRQILSLPLYTFARSDAVHDEVGVLLSLDPWTVWIRSLETRIG